MIIIIALLILIILAFDLSNIRKQHDQIKEQNEEIIEILREIRDKVRL
ncbi:hypothetical protein SAMN04487943_101381 [Gracilibacillus orientalis]|uniref:Uncharacterized protein n=1 Tax=Gracilibacillus orientalis TaxID=334253 RepID=A0A1I4HFU3_9BACI|nr:hypothetical protein SAMN04487943_101381 [Gracilibacillus orientalis]